jgi:hypothetical protein
MSFLSSRPWLAPLAFYAGIGLCLSQSHGAYHPQMIPFFCVLFLAYVVCTHLKISTVDPALLYRFGPLVVVIFAIGQAVHPLLFYAVHPSSVYSLFKGSLAFTVIASGIWAWMAVQPSRERGARIAFWICVISFFLAQFLIPLVSPEPEIDVFVKIRLAAEHLLHGENPYGAVYPDIYGGRYGNFSGFPYLPGLLAWVVPFQALTGDPRTALIAADLLTGAVLYRLCGNISNSNRLSQIVYLLWLSFPVSLFIIEQSWIDNLLILELSCLALALNARRWTTAGIFLGLLLATKQYTIFVVVITFVMVTIRKESLFKMAASCVVVCLGLILPFLAINPHRFLYDTVYSFGEITFRTDSFSIPALLKNRWDLNLPPYLPLALYMSTLVGSLYSLWRVPQAITWSRALVIMYTVTFLFGVQAFCNYYQLVAFLVLLNMVLILGGIKLSPPFQTAK